MSAVNSGAVASVLGYLLKAGKFGVTTSNLPQRLSVLCEANAANNVAGLDTAEWEATSLKAVGDRYGYGSPAYLIARLALPALNGIPLVFYPQEEAAGATAKIIEITPTGTATETTTHYVKLAGRLGLDGDFYAFSVVKGDTSAQINQKIEDAISAVLGAPCDVISDDYTTTLTSKWKGSTANKIKCSIFTDGVDAGITYSVDENVQAGSGVPSIADALVLMTPKWNTITINSYGTNSAIADALENWNGKPGDTPTGRYAPTIMKPTIAFSGFETETETTFTDARKNQVTISMAPMPEGENLPFEMAAILASTFAQTVDSNPALDVLDKYATDIVAPLSIGSMSEWSERDRVVKLGQSTVDLVGGQYQFKDIVTTYHPLGELVPAWRWVRDLFVDFNLKYRYRILEETYLIGKVIVADGETVTNSAAISPGDWKGIILEQLIAPAISDGLITDKDFSKKSLVVQIDSTNPNRFNTWFDYKKTGIVRISSTEVRSGYQTFKA